MRDAGHMPSLNYLDRDSLVQMKRDCSSLLQQPALFLSSERSMQVLHLTASSGLLEPRCLIAEHKVGEASANSVDCSAPR